MGRYVLYGASRLSSGETKSFLGPAKFWWQVDKISPMKLYDENRTVSGFNLRRLLYQQDEHAYVRKLVEKVYKLYEDKTISSVIDSTWAFEDVAEAMQKMHDRKNLGKIILDPAQEPKPRPPEEETVKGKKKGGKEKGEGDAKKDENGEKEESKAEPAAK
jgi:hypothetical protein